MSEPSKDIGSVLKQERENQGVSLETVHEATKIPIDSLKAIEEGYKVRTLTSFYYKSFVRIYAQYLGLEPESLLEKITSELPRKKVEIQRSGAATKKGVEPLSLRLPARPLNYKGAQKIVKVAGVIAVVAVAVVLVFVLIRKIRSAVSLPSSTVVQVEKHPGKKVKVVPSVVPETVKRIEEKKKPEVARPVEVVKPTESVEPLKPVLPVKKSESVKKTEPAQPVEVKPVPVENKPVETAVGKPEPVKNTSAVPTARKVSVAVRAMNNAWLNVRSDGSPVFQGILKKGASDSWSAVKVIDISGKDINQLEFEVNGKPIGRLSRRGAPAKKIRITPEGLTVEK